MKPHRPILFAIVTVLAVILLARTARADLQVVATVPTLAALARDLGGENVSVTSLALPTQDPHFVDAKPSLALKLNKADLLLVVGLGLESGWLPPLLTGARNAAIQPGADGYLDCSSAVHLLDADASADRSKGDIHPGGNPHYLYDPRQLEHVAIAVSASLMRLDPSHAKQHQERLSAFVKQVHRVQNELEKQMKPYAGTAIISYHRSWVYLTDWLGLKTVAHLEPKPGIPPNPSHVAKVLVAARRHHVKALVQESFYPNATAELVAEKSGAKVVTLPGGADFRGGQHVLDYLEQLTGELRKALQ